MRKITLIITSVAAALVLGITVSVNVLGPGAQPSGGGTGTTECAPRESAAPSSGATPETAAPDTSDGQKADDTGCEIPGDGGKPGEAPKD